MRIKDFSEFSDKEIESIYKTVCAWEWDYRLGKKPFLFDELIHYKKPHNMKYRLKLLFGTIWPRTKEDYLEPFLKERRERKLKKTLLVYPNEQLAREESEKRFSEKTMEKSDYEFSDGSFSLSEDIDPEIAEKSLWAFEQDTETGVVIVVPMNGEKLVVHGKKEAEMFCQFLIECFQ